MKTRAAVCNGANEKLVIEDIMIGEPGPKELRVKIEASGLCGTDLGGLRGTSMVAYPVVLGHEGAGIVDAVGRGATKFKVGDRVALSYKTCGECACCKAGNSSGCKQFVKLNFLPDFEVQHLSKMDGSRINQWFAMSSFAEHAIVSETACAKIPDKCPSEVAAPFGCGIITGAGAMLNFLDAKEGESAVIAGLGTVGFAGLLAAVVRGCNPIIAVGGTPWKLELAKKLGATHVINRSETEDVVAAIKEILPDGANVLMDATGKAYVCHELLHCVSKHARVAFAASYAPSEVISIPYREFPEFSSSNSKVGYVLEGDCDNVQMMGYLLDLYQQGKYPIDQLFSYYDFEDVNQAIDDLVNHKIIKAVLKMS